MKHYNWQLSDWPLFSYDLSVLQEDLYPLIEQKGFIEGQYSSLHHTAKLEIFIDLVLAEALKTSEIEGEYLQRGDVRSSIKNQLNLDEKKLFIHDKRAQGISELMLNMLNTVNKPLSQSQLFSWHKILFIGQPKSFRTGYWRTHADSMRIVSQMKGKDVIHFVAPPSKIVPKEMKNFIQWFNRTGPGKPEFLVGPIRAAIAHLYFESIHPFEDGNGRIGRAIAQKALLEDHSKDLMVSLSQVIANSKKDYYDALHRASLSNEITSWIQYFLRLIAKAQKETQLEIEFIIQKTIFFDQFKNRLNDRQLKVINRMLKEGPRGFRGGMSAKKYMTLTKVSKATATRDLQELCEINALKQIGKGRNVHYSVNLGNSKFDNEKLSY